MVRVGWNAISGEGAFGAPRPQDRDPRQVTPGNGQQTTPVIGGNGAGPVPFDISSSIPNNFWGYVMLVVGMR